jgi:hypothetical protein
MNFFRLNANIAPDELLIGRYRHRRREVPESQRRRQFWRGDTPSR